MAVSLSSKPPTISIGVCCAKCYVVGLPANTRLKTLFVQSIRVACCSTRSKVPRSRVSNPTSPEPRTADCREDQRVQVVSVVSSKAAVFC